MLTCDVLLASQAPLLAFSLWEKQYGVKSYKVSHFQLCWLLLVLYLYDQQQSMIGALLLILSACASPVL